MKFRVKYLNNNFYKRLYLITYENGNIEYIVCNGYINIKKKRNNREIIKDNILFRCDTIEDLYKYYNKGV